MANIVALLLVVAVAALCHAAAASQVISFDASKPAHACPSAFSPQRDHGLVFAFKSFSFAAFSAKVGAYEGSTQQQQQPCASLECPAFALKQHVEEYSICQFESNMPASTTQVVVDGADISGVLQLAANAGGALRVINFPNTAFQDLSSTESALINQALELARGSGEKIFFTEIPQVAAGKRRALDSIRNEFTFTPLRMMPELFLGLFLVISCSLALITFFCCCMDGIATQPKYAKAYPQKGKEQN